MPKIAHEETSPDHRASAALTRIARSERPSRAGAEQAAPQAAATTQELRQAVQGPAGDAAELGRTMIDLFGEQTRHNLETAVVLARAVSWTEIADAQRAFLGDSFERMNRLGEHYRAMLQVGMKSAAFPARH